MIKHPFSSFRSLCSTVSNHSNQVVAGTLAVGMAVINCLPALAAPPKSQPQSLGNLSDGVYLYGQSPKPEQIGQGYFVFEVNRGKVIGALYMPRSSFDCASGSFKDNQLALTVVNSYDRSTNPYEIAVERSSTVATTGNPTPQEIGLQGFHRLPTVSENDLRILNMCKTDFQKRK
ncbi:MAG: hypothetical protein WCA35_30510 [Kovacikia sp.]